MIAIVRDVKAGVEHRLQQWLAFTGLDKIPVNRDVDNLGRVSQFGARCHEVSGLSMFHWAVHAELDPAA